MRSLARFLQPSRSMPMRKYRPASSLASTPLHSILCDQHDPSALAVVCQSASGTSTLTFGELRDRSLRLASALRCEAGVRSGDCVGVMLPKTSEVHVCAVALARLGATYLPLCAKRYNQPWNLLHSPEHGYFYSCTGSQHSGRTLHLHEWKRRAPAQPSPLVSRYVQVVIRIQQHEPA